MLRFLKYCFFSALFFGVLLLALCGGVAYYLVAVVPSPEIEESHISDILGRESPVFYRDGTTKLGVLFEGIHRQYLSHDELPKNFVNALVAAEDDQFFHHFGIDLPGIARAMLANLKAGRVVQGGSTITQQTAKNLFKRESRSLEAKLKELLYALRLEHRYPKEKILEFYSNQFFVSGNGHGLGVAARYFFDKEPQELTLLECAFIAGSVKRPNYYNPFLKKNVENPEQIKQRVDERVGYVLGQMRKAGMISEAEFAVAKENSLVFKQGKMTFAQNSIMDLVKEGLDSPLIAESLEEHGISNISTSGARVITTVDPALQQRTSAALRRQLSVLDVRLRGYHRALVQTEYKALDYQGDADIVAGAFLFGTIKEISSGKTGVGILVTFDEQQAEGLIDDAGLKRMVEALAKFKKNAWAVPGPADTKAMLNELRAGDMVYVSVRGMAENGRWQLELERYPEVEGAAYVLQEGAMRAMIGGMANRHFNRATAAKRLMGSTFKTFVFSAALQLGWSPLDLLDNHRGVFSFMGQPYYPKPDHDSPFGQVTLSWAGVTSENVAAVWLLHHLTDHLTPPQIRELAVQLDMAPRDQGGAAEPYQQYKERIRDRFGIVLSRGLLEQAAYDSAVKALKPDFVFEGRTGEYNQLLRLAYGYRSNKPARPGRDTEDEDQAETQQRLAAERLTFQYLRTLAPQLQAFRRMVEGQLGRYLDDPFTAGEPYRGGPTVGMMARNAVGDHLFTLRTEMQPGWQPLGTRELLGHLAALDAVQRNDFWQRVQLEGAVSLGALEQVGQQVQQEQEKFLSSQPYNLDVLGQIRDFRIMLGLQYLIRLARECGIGSTMEPVLSLPLGSNVVSLSELVRMYETIISGHRFEVVARDGRAARNGGDEPESLDGLAVIDRIETPDGRVVYARQMRRARVFDPRISAALSNILQNTVSYGTGRHAAEHVRLRSVDPQAGKDMEKVNLPVPLLGKTGTANSYRNAAFAGYVPVLASGTESSLLTLEGGYTIGVYTGYDSNKPMVKGATRISGSQGPLPAWSDIAQALLDLEHIGDRLDAVDLTFNGLVLEYPAADQVFVGVNPQQGGAALPGSNAVRQQIPPTGPASLWFGEVLDNGRLEPERLFLPFWKSR